MEISFPSIIVPPIPDKHSIVAYAAKPGKAQVDPNIIFKRKRLLQSFLNRVASHPILSNFHPFHLFLMGQGSWNEVLSSFAQEINLPLQKKVSLPVMVEKRKLKKPGIFNLMRSPFYCST
jgi:sorting nexin-4